MLMTEEHARMKWCPHARVNTLVTGTDYNETAVGGAACNRADPSSMYEKATCIASDCMAWQLAQKPRQVVKNYHDDAAAIPVSFANGVRTYPDGWQYEITDHDRDGRKFDYLSRPAPDDAPEVGYCGAFHRPGP